MTGNEPRPTSDIDFELTHTIRRFHRLRWYSVAALSAVVIVALTVGGIVLSHQQHQLTASCGLYHDLGTLDIRPVPPATKAGKVAVTIVLDSRKAFRGQCSGSLPAPSPALVYWAHYYRMHIP